MLRAKVGDGSDLGQKVPLLSHWLIKAPVVISSVFGPNFSSVGFVLSHPHTNL